MQSLHTSKIKITFTYFTLFADNVRALLNIWLVGDDFIRTNCDELKQSKTAAKLANSQPSYMLQTYNISAHYAKFGVTSINRFLSPIIEALNQ